MCQSEEVLLLVKQGQSVMKSSEYMKGLPDLTRSLIICRVGQMTPFRQLKRLYIKSHQALHVNYTKEVIGAE